MKETKTQTPFERLSALAEKYPTDKKEHLYLAPYAAYLPETCRYMLEIGVAQGYSAQMWSEYFGPDCDIHLVDLFENPDFKSPAWCRLNNFVPHQGDQSDLEFLYTIRTKFQLLIDDGSHRADHMIQSFMHLFLHNLLSGGLYVIEDLHCNVNKFFWGNVENFSDTILATLQRYQRSKLIENPYFNEGDSIMFQNLISRVEIVNDKIAFIWKR